MKDYYYYQAFRKTTVQVLDLFNDIQINRYDQGGNWLKRVEVPLKYSPKEKIWFWLNERNDDEQLPIMSLALTGIDYSLERAGNKHKKLVECSSSTPSAATIASYLNPIPYDLNFTLSVWSLYMSDVDQILEQILPYFQPYVFVRVYSPDLDTTFEVKVIFQSATPEHEFEYTDDTFRILKYSLEFVAQTYMFRPIENTGLIKSVLLNYYTDTAAWESGIRTESTFTSAASGETQRFTSIAPWQLSDGDPIYDYELFNFGSRVGNVSHINHAPSATHVY